MRFRTFALAAVAAMGFAATTAGKRLAIPGTINRLGATVVRLAPRGLVLRIARILLLG